MVGQRYMYLTDIIKFAPSLRSSEIGQCVEANCLLGIYFTYNISSHLVSNAILSPILCALA